MNQPSTNTPDTTRLRWASALLVAGFLAGYVAVMFAGDDFRRPLEHDELITLRYYTWAGIEPDGWQRPLARLEELHSLDRPGLRQLAIGAYCSVGRWPEPNNHVVGSLLTNLTMAVGRPSAESARVAALLGAAGAGLAMFWLLAMRLGWVAIAPLATLLLLGTPYLLVYGQSIRGYSWLLCLQLLLLLALLRVADRPASIFRGAVAAAIAMLSFANVVTMALYWVLPVYAAMAWVAPDGRGRAGGMPASDRSAWHRSLAIQFLAIGAVGFVFLADRLPYIYSSAQQYGSTFHTPAEFVRLLGNIIHYLLPNLGWKLLGAVGVVGLIWTPSGTPARTIAWIALFATAAMLGHFLLGGRLPYARVCGFLLVSLVLGVAALAERLIEAGSRNVVRAAAWTGSAAAAVLLVALTSYAGIENPGFTRFVQELTQLAPAIVPVRALRDNGLPLSTELYYPHGWQNASQPLPRASAAELCVLLKRDAANGWKLPLQSQQGVANWDLGGWPATVRLESDDRYRVVALPGQTLPKLPPEGSDLDIQRCVLFWYPSPESVTVTPEPLLEHLNKHAVRFLPIQGRYQAKLEVFGRITCVVLVADTLEQRRKALQAIRAGAAQFGDRAVLFIPVPVGETLPGETSPAGGGA